MALVKCKECGGELSTAAKACPKCGSPVPKGKKLLIGCASVVVALVVLAIIGAAMKKPDATSNAAAPSGPTIDPASATKPMPVTAKELHQDYIANEVAADDKYKGKLLAVGGTVASIDKDFLDNVVVKITWPGNEDFGLEDVAATLRESEKSKAAQLQKGQVIVARCTGNGMVVRSPMLSDCVVFTSAK